eukprot:GSMAST32.ASY1.ANO1.1329.1 assembled CDS
MNVITVLVSGGAGQIAYSLLPLIAQGKVFGPNTSVHLRLLEIPRAVDALKGVAMELQDCAFPLLLSVVCTSDNAEAFTGIDYAVLLGGFPRLPGMLRKDLIEKNVGIFKNAGESLEKYASSKVKVLVVANPANTNCLCTMWYAPSVPRENFSCLTRLDHERLRENFISTSDINHLAIWGNHSATQVPDATFATINQDSRPPQNAWFQGQLCDTVRSRGKAVINARGKSSALSAANAIGLHLHDWYHGSRSGDFVSMGIPTDGNDYGIPDDLVFSFPVVTSSTGKINIVSGLKLSKWTREQIKNTVKELIEEREAAKAVISKL